MAEILSTPFEFTNDERRRIEALTDDDIEALATGEAINPPWTNNELREAVRLRKLRIAAARRAEDDDKTLAKTR